MLAQPAEIASQHVSANSDTVLYSWYTTGIPLTGYSHLSDAASSYRHNTETDSIFPAIILDYNQCQVSLEACLASLVSLLAIRHSAHFVLSVA